MRIFSLLAGLMLALSVSAAELRFDFSNAHTLTNFSPALLGEGAPADWKVVMDEVPPSLAPLTALAPKITSQAVLAQKSQDAADERFPMFIYRPEVFRNFTFMTRFKIVSGVTEQMAGVVFRYQNVSNFYVVRISVLGHNLKFYKVVNGIRSAPIGPALNINVGEWHALSVKCEGNQIAVSLDDRPVLPELGDNTFADGRIGFWTKSDSVSCFGEAMVFYTPRVAAAQTMVNSVMEKQTRLLGLQIYAADENNPPRIIASNDASEVGKAGTEAEQQALANGVVYFGRDDGAVLVTLPMRDRNGETIAAVRVKLKSFLGETQNNAVTRATTILKKLQALCISAEDLRK